MLCGGYSDYFLTNLPFWGKLTEDEKRLLCSETVAVKYSAGDILHGGDDDCVGVIFVKSGQLRAYMLSEDGRDITLYRLYKGDICIMSASCVFDSITFEVFVEAVGDSEILLIGSSAFKRVFESNIYVEAYGYKAVTERFSDVMWTMQQILFMSFDKRLAIFLSDEASKNGSDEIRLTHEQIAKYMGSAREVVSRMLKYFSSEGIVELSRGEIRITDRKKLRQLTV